METLKNTLNASPYFPILVTVVLGFFIGKITIGRLALGSIIGTLLVGMGIGQIGVDIDPTIRWIFFGLFMYVVGYQGGYQLINTLQRRKKSILLASASMSVFVIATLAIACWLFELDLFVAIGMTAGSFVHPEIINVANDAIGQSPSLTHAAKNVAESKLNMGYMLTVVFGVLGPVLMMTWLLPMMMKWTSIPVDSRDDSSGGSAQRLTRHQSINTAQSIVRRVFEVNKQSTVVGKTIKQLNAPSIDIIFELLRAERCEKSGNDSELIGAGDLITIIGRHNTLFYFDDNVLGTELPYDMQLDTSEENYLMLINTHDLVGKSLHKIKTDINQHTHRDVCITQLIRGEKALEVTPDLTVKHHDIVQFTGSSSDVEIVKNSFGRMLSSTGINQALFGIGLVLAYLISMWHLNVGGLYLYFSMGLSSLISGIVVGWACHKLNPLDLLSVRSTNHVRDLSLLAFTAVTGLYFGPQMIGAMDASGMKVSLIGSGVVLFSQFISFVIAYRILNIKNPIELMGCVSGSHHSGLGMSAFYRPEEAEGAIYAVTVSYIISSFLMLFTVSIILKFL